MMRIKHRYVLVQTTQDIAQAYRDGSFESQLFKELLHYVGEINFHRVNPKLIRLVANNRFIIKCDLAGYRDLILAFSMVKRLENSEMGFYTLKSSGTIRALTK